jgi:hypothetical protein
VTVWRRGVGWRRGGVAGLARVRAFALASMAGVALVALVGCSSASDTGTPAQGGSATSAAAHPIDRGAVDAILDKVLNALTIGTGIGSDTSLTDASTTLDQASAELADASQLLTPAPQGVPDSLAASIATSLTQISGQLDQAAVCLRAQATVAPSDPRTCLPPLRAAQDNDAAVSRDLIRLAAYGSRTPAAFERLLVRAPQGGQ